MIFNNGDKIGKYIVINFLGKGNFGEAYFVYDTILDKKVVIKLFFDGEINELAKEAQNQTRLKHNHVVEVNAADVIKDVAISNNGLREVLQKFPQLKKIPHLAQVAANGQSTTLNVLYIDMEYMAGGSVGKKMQSYFISTRTAIEYMISTLAAVEYIHGQGYIHKDIKPDNILLDDKNIPKLADFGLSDHITSVKNGGYTTHIPPEHFSGTPHSELSDVFALGLTLFRLINNYNNWRDIVKKHLTMDDLKKGKVIEKIGFEDFVPDKLRKVTKKACHKDANKRYKTISDFKNALAKIFPSISWFRASQDMWRAEEGKSTQEVSIVHRVKRQEYELIFKKNSRTQNTLTKIFTSIDDARATMHEYIRGTY